MSTTNPESRVSQPWLVDGETLDRATFHERYEAMPEETRAELIGGVVYFMASALGRNHGWRHMTVSQWLGFYMLHTPGVRALDNGTVFFDNYGEPQPDIAVLIRPEFGGRTRDEGKYYVNGPEMIIEIADSSIRIDLGPKLIDYERAGVLEYLVFGVDPLMIRRHIRRDGRLVEVGPGPDGLYRSPTFPGLWLDPAALFADDLRSLRAAVELGVATDEHAAFVAKLAQNAAENRA